MCSLYGILLPTLSFLFASGVVGMNFTCQRPTTPCDTWHGMCQPDGRCACSNGASGLRCHISGNAKRDTGSCLVHNSCVTGTCYDDGVVAKCDCGEGYYGDFCRHRMVYAECDVTKMVINIFPYGFGIHTWDKLPPVTGENFTCSLDTIPVFVKGHPGFSSRMWQGYAGGFLHVADPCAGDPDILADTATSITYARKVYITYGSQGPDPTDQTVVVSCDVAKIIPTAAPVVLPPASVRVSFRTASGAQVTGPMKLGAKIHVYFTLNIPNRDGFDDIQVEMCIIRDNVSSRNVVIVNRACAYPPLGELLYKKGPGVAVLIMSVYKVPGMSSLLNLQCQLQGCNKNTDNYCSTPAQCHTRGKRSWDDKQGTLFDNNFLKVNEMIYV